MKGFRNRDKARAPLKKRSKKQEEKYNLRRPFVEKILRERRWCEACPKYAEHDGAVTYVRRPSSDVHEIIRRSQGGSIIDESNVLAVCRRCHERIGRNPKIAFELGLAKHGWEQDKTDDPGS
jgi:5-methylcytosine-specific restriction endonuclease McrA